MLDATTGNVEDVFDAQKQRRKPWIKGITSEPITATNQFISGCNLSLLLNILLFWFSDPYFIVFKRRCIMTAVEQKFLLALTRK